MSLFLTHDQMVTADLLSLCMGLQLQLIVTFSGIQYLSAHDLFRVLGNVYRGQDPVRALPNYLDIHMLL